MPTVSMFYGILIRMFKEDNAKHKSPHIHAKYNEHEAVYLLNGVLLEGSIPAKQGKLVVAWIALHEDELAADWELISAGEPIFKIKPLE